MFFFLPTDSSFVIDWSSRFLCCCRLVVDALTWLIGFLITINTSSESHWATSSRTHITIFKRRHHHSNRTDKNSIPKSTNKTGKLEAGLLKNQFMSLSCWFTIPSHFTGKGVNQSDYCILSKHDVWLTWCWSTFPSKETRQQENKFCKHNNWITFASQDMTTTKTTIAGMNWSQCLVCFINTTIESLSSWFLALYFERKSVENEREWSPHQVERPSHLFWIRQSLSLRGYDLFIGERKRRRKDLIHCLLIHTFDKSRENEGESSSCLIQCLRPQSHSPSSDEIIAPKWIKRIWNSNLKLLRQKVPWKRCSWAREEQQQQDHSSLRCNTWTREISASILPPPHLFIIISKVYLTITHTRILKQPKDTLSTTLFLRTAKLLLKVILHSLSCFSTKEQGICSLFFPVRTRRVISRHHHHLIEYSWMKRKAVGQSHSQEKETGLVPWIFEHHRLFSKWPSSSLKNICSIDRNIGQEYPIITNKVWKSPFKKKESRQLSHHMQHQQHK